MIFFYKETKSNKKKSGGLVGFGCGLGSDFSLFKRIQLGKYFFLFVLGGGGGRGGGGTRVSE